MRPTSIKEQYMPKRIKQALLALVAIGALAIGGATVAQAGSTSTVEPAVESTAPDTDKIQSGDQSTPDTPKASKAAAAEAPGETAPNSDGPGGHADEPR
jgi:hypothetical protein